VLPADYTFTAADAGTHTFQVTLKTTGSQTVTATDVNSSGFTGSATYSVDAQLIDLQPALPSPGTFSQGQTNASYQVVVTNQGSLPSSGPVTVINAVGTGLTVTAISGTGWNCTLPTLTCTRSDVVGAGLSYPNITLVLTVAANAPSSIQVGATVSGGGDTNPANDTSTAHVSVGPVLAITSSSGNATVSAGQPAVFTFGVSASAGAGTVTFSCSGLPTLAACSFSPPSLNGTSGNVTMTITTTARSSVFGFRGPGGWNPVMFFGLFFLAALATFSLHFRAPRFKRLAPVAGLMAILIVGILAGCGGGGSTPPPPPPVVGTPAGTSVITFTATSPTGTASKVVNLTVN